VSVNGQEVKSVADLQKRVTGAVSSINVGRDGAIIPLQFR
jgi:hypothetical protein